MDNLTQAMRGAAHEPRAPLLRLSSALVVGAGGTLGSAVLAEALVAGRFQRVSAVITAPLASTLKGLHPVTLADLQEDDGPPCELALLVFERQRHSNGRDDAFLQPDASELVNLARLLHRAGVRRLMVLVPHAPALLPHALKAGFASQDEGAVAALGFEHLVFVRAAQSGIAASSGNAMQRFASWWLSQLNWMVPSSEQPVRAVKLAALVVQLARRLPEATPGTRVLPPEVLQRASQAEDPEQELRAWLLPARP
jgi:hypothetical protein